MSKTITLRLDDKKYAIFKQLAEQENRPISNFIETATLFYIQSQTEVDPYEMADITHDAPLMASLKQGLADANAGAGYFL